MKKLHNNYATFCCLYIYFKKSTNLTYNMKTLSNHILEEFTPVNEAFNSSIIKTVFDNNQKLFKEALHGYSGLNLKWSEIQDTDVEQWDDMKKALWHAKQSHGIIAIWLQNDSLLGMSNGNWVSITSRYHGISRRSYKPQFSSVSAISKSATKALIIRNLPDSALNAVKLKNDRWASKVGAAEYQNNYNIADDNKKRYLAIIAKRKLDKSKEAVNADAIVQEAVNLSAATLVNLAGDADWKSIIKMNSLITELLKKYDEYVRYDNGAKRDAEIDKASSFYADYAIKYLDEVKTLAAKITDYNKEFIDEE